MIFFRFVSPGLGSNRVMLHKRGLQRSRYMRTDHWKLRRCKKNLTCSAQRKEITVYKRIPPVHTKHGDQKLCWGIGVSGYVVERPAGPHGHGARPPGPGCQDGPGSRRSLETKGCGARSTQWRDRILWSRPTRTTGQTSSRFISYFGPRDTAPTL